MTLGWGNVVLHRKFKVKELKVCASFSDSQKVGIARQKCCLTNFYLDCNLFGCFVNFCHF